VGLHAGLARRSIVIDSDDLCPARFLELQDGDLIVGHVAKVDAQVSLGAARRSAAPDVARLRERRMHEDPINETHTGYQSKNAD
jgi:hypothetical protein